MLSRFFFLVALLLGGTPLIGAYAVEGIVTRVEHSWKKYHSNRSFWVVPFDDKHGQSFKFRQLAAVVEGQLKRQGLTRAPHETGTPNLLVILGFGNAASRTEELEYPYFRTQGAMPFIPKKPPAMPMRQGYTGMRPSDWRLVTVGATPHYGAVVSVIIAEMDWRKPQRSKVLWKGAAMGTDTQSVAGREPTMIRMLFQKFPSKSRKPKYWDWQGNLLRFGWESVVPDL